MTRNKLTKIIENHQTHIKDGVRDYIGASSIGSDCWRQIWYEFNGYEGSQIPPKTRRTWDIGKNLEGLVYEWLISAGVDIRVMQGDHYSEDLPFFRGHSDGIVKIDKEFHIIEIKTAKDASFKIFLKDGVKLWNSRYYAQLQSYMGLSGVNSAYILVLNKDNSEISDELVHFDKDFYETLKNKAQMIANAELPPPRINSSPIWYECKLCKFNKECHEK